MSLRRAICLSGGVAALLATALAQRPFREYPGSEYGQFPLPPDWQQPAEWVFARLMYPPAYGFGRGFRRFGGYGNWTQGASSWTTDYPRSDRHFAQALRRLTRVHTRSVEQPVNLDDGDQYDWPWLYAVEVGHWDLTDNQVKVLREYLLRGGFLFCDDFHGGIEWEVFIASMKRVFPDRPIVDIPNNDPIFHSLYDLDDRFQIPGVYYIYRGITYERPDSQVANWRGIYDDRGRVMVAIVHNSDLGDAWEWADDPRYPEKFSGMAIRIAVNYVVYSMSH